MKKVLYIALAVCMLFVVGCFALSPVDLAAQTVANNDSDSALAMLSYKQLVRTLESENVDVDDPDSCTVNVLIQIYDDPTKNWTVPFIDYNATSEEVDAFLLAHRRAVADFYSNYNNDAVEKLGLGKYNYVCSLFSAFIEIIFDSVEEYSRCQAALQEIITNNKDIVASVGIYVIPKDISKLLEADINGTDYTVNYPLSDAFDDIGTSNSTYTGNGIKVGVIDEGVPSSTVNLITGKYLLLDTEQSSHCLTVASIIGGTSGIARNAFLYFKKDTSSILGDANELINTYHVNVINMSLGFAAVGKYLNYDACVDNVVSNSGCTFVKSAGNNGTGNKLVTAPGCSMDAITVGNIGKNKKLRATSSWKTNDDALYKPDVVAPGSRLWDIPNISNASVGHSGTSFSAPMVTGSIALLMEEFPVLKTRPALVKSVVHLGAVQLPSQTGYFDAQAGFGLINYPNMRNILQSTAYQEFSVLANSVNGNTVKSFNVTIPYENRISVNANLIVNSNVTTSNSGLAQMVYTNYCIKIYNTATDNCVATSNINSPMDYLLYTNTNPLYNSFRIDIVLTSDNSNLDVEKGAFAYEIENLHTHSYNSSYATYSNTQHKSICACGDYVLEGHVVPAGAFPTATGLQYAWFAADVQRQDMLSTPTPTNCITRQTAATFCLTESSCW